MADAVYALLVGIDDYPAGVSALRGCVADVEAVQALLRDLVPGAQLVVLRNGEATVAAVRAAFTEHLGRAGAGDTALFWYAGHGSQAISAAPRFVEPSGFDQTLVLADSRTPSGRDLRDKELASLIAGVAASGARVVVGLDCCHSGSGTREADPDVAVRRAPTDLRAPAASTGPALDTSSAGPDSGVAWHLGAAGRHVLLAACRSDQTAKEVTVAGARRGALTSAVEQVLRRATGPMTYRDLHREVSAAVRRAVADQVPQLESVVPEDLDGGLLGAALRPRLPHHLLTHDGQGWSIDAGGVHGIAGPAPRGTTTLLVFPMSATGAQLVQRSGAVARAQVTRVEPDRALVSLDTGLDEGTTYRAVVTGTPLPALSVHVSGTGERVVGYRAAIGATALLALAAGGADATVTCGADGDRLVDLRTGIELPPPASVADGVQSLERVARWHRLARLGELGGGIDTTRLELRLRDGDAEVPREGDELRVTYQLDGTPPAPVAEVHNGTGATLYCALLSLSASYAVSLGRTEVGATVPVPPGATMPLRGGAPLRPSVPDELYAQGVTSRTDRLLLLTANVDFDPTALSQPRIGHAVSATALREVTAPPSVLQRLLGSVATREVDDDDDPVALAEWCAVVSRLTTLRPAPGTPVGDAPTQLATGVTIAGPDGFAARALLTNSAEAGRDALAPLLPPALRDDPDVSSAFSVVDVRDASAALDVVELSGITGAERVTPDTPLVLTLPHLLAEDERVLVTGWDGEFYLPLGYARRSGYGTTVHVTTLPPAVTTRSLASSVRMLFRRLVAKPLGLPTDVTRLAIATVAAGGEVYYDDDPGRLADAVRASHRVLLHVHGILGDTRGMVRSAYTALPNGTAPVADDYDLVLAFDYENIGTPVSETARSLADKLAAAGFGPDDGTCLDVVAHSMGGLVSRWWVELGPGAQLADRLVMFGTPNHGSPLPRIQDWAFVALGFGLNRLATVFWPAHVFASLLAAIERVDVALDDMAPNSERLAQLHAAPDPGVPYTMVIGDRALIPVADGTVIERLLRALGPAGIKDLADKLAFHGVPNDIAVTVDSAQYVPAERTPAMATTVVACDHVTYFSADAGRSALAAVLRLPAHADE